MSTLPPQRGAAPVGVRTVELRDETREGRTLPIEVWYPADEAHRGQDFEPAHMDRFEVVPGFPEVAQHAVRDARPAEGPFPLVAFSHGATSHRRSASHLLTHLASHGYVAASADHVGNTLPDFFHDLTTGAASGEGRLVNMFESAADRPRDVVQLLDAVLGGADPALAGLADAERVGTCGVSFGGWTSLHVNSIDPRPRASFPIVPAWGPGPLKTEQLSNLVRLDDWGRAVPTCVLAAERDALVMLPALRDLHAKLAGPKQLAVLHNAGHVHFIDKPEERHEELRTAWSSNQLPIDDPEIDFAAIAEASRPFSELCSADHAHEVVKALCLAHMDAHLKADAGAAAWLAGDPAADFTARGIDVEIV
ncbi:MAG: hypothetical protein GY772_03685 [bacterium]|nr:hypothetical protein [bacterium]MDP7074685.1 hypothetical protein [Myxococcota bacterium]MDP7297993.1 hypothetical protein [Myxococcota bacterium]HJO23071.1 hypothetical protein [Myxococcota bacterium]